MQLQKKFHTGTLMALVEYSIEGMQWPVNAKMTGEP